MTFPPSWMTIFTASVTVSRNCAVLYVSRETSAPWALRSKNALGNVTRRAKSSWRITCTIRNEMRDIRKSPTTAPTARTAAAASISAGNSQT